MDSTVDQFKTISAPGALVKLECPQYQHTNMSLVAPSVAPLSQEPCAGAADRCSKDKRGRVRGNSPGTVACSPKPPPRGRYILFRGIKTYCGYAGQLFVNRAPHSALLKNSTSSSWTGDMKSVCSLIYSAFVQLPTDLLNATLLLTPATRFQKSSPKLKALPAPATGTDTDITDPHQREVSQLEHKLVAVIVDSAVRLAAARCNLEQAQEERDTWMHLCHELNQAQAAEPATDADTATTDTTAKAPAADPCHGLLPDLLHELQRLADENAALRDRELELTASLERSERTGREAESALQLQVDRLGRKVRSLEAELAAVHMAVAAEQSKVVAARLAVNKKLESLTQQLRRAELERDLALAANTELSCKSDPTGASLPRMGTSSSMLSVILKKSNSEADVSNGRNGTRRAHSGPLASARDGEKEVVVEQDGNGGGISSGDRSGSEDLQVVCVESVDGKSDSAKALEMTLRDMTGGDQQDASAPPLSDSTSLLGTGPRLHPHFPPPSTDTRMSQHTALDSMTLSLDGANVHNPSRASDNGSSFTSRHHNSFLLSRHLMDAAAISATTQAATWCPNDAMMSHESIPTEGGPSQGLHPAGLVPAGGADGVVSHVLSDYRDSSCVEDESSHLAVFDGEEDLISISGKTPLRDERPAVTLVSEGEAAGMHTPIRIPDPLACDEEMYVAREGAGADVKAILESDMTGSEAAAAVEAATAGFEAQQQMRPSDGAPVVELKRSGSAPDLQMEPISAGLPQVVSPSTSQNGTASAIYVGTNDNPIWKRLTRQSEEIEAGSPSPGNSVLAPPPPETSIKRSNTAPLPGGFTSKPLNRSKSLGKRLKKSLKRLFTMK